MLLTSRKLLQRKLLDLECELRGTLRKTSPGVGGVVALTYRATVDQPQRFVHSRAVGAHVGVTPKRYQSDETDYDGGVRKCGDALLRTMLYEAAHSLLCLAAMAVVAPGKSADARGLREAIGSDRRHQRSYVD